MTEIICLSMNGCKLESLERFPNLPKLVRLELIENEFDGNELTHLSHQTVFFFLSKKQELQSLSLGCNAIKELEQLKPLIKLTNLIQLDLSDCPISQKEGYRNEVFKLFPDLKILDNKDQEGQEFEYSESDLEDGEGGYADEDGEEDEDSDDGVEDVDSDEEEVDDDEDENAAEGGDQEEDAGAYKKFKN